MSDKKYLILENGSVYEGLSFGADTDTVGEVVFTTAMTGYCETLTDKSYYGQIIVQSFPLIGNYGVIPSDFESRGIHAVGYIVSDRCQSPSNFRCDGTLDTFLKSQNVPGIYGIDTRRLVKELREKGAMNGKISDTPDSDPSIKDYRVKNAVESVTSHEKTVLNSGGRFNIALYDFGYKENIVRELIKRDCALTVFPASSTAEEIFAISPDGIMLSNGPGDPADNPFIIEQLRKLLDNNEAIFGICLGHQLLALANGFSTGKLKFGHRGANHPAKNMMTGRTYITSQNHGYTVLTDSIDKSIAQELFVNVNDGTNEGLIYMNKYAFSSQFHPEGCGGPQDSNYLFDEFIHMIKDRNGEVPSENR